MKILVVEDSFTDRAIIEQILADTEHDVRCEETASKALEVIESWQPDLILSDVLLPDQSGLEMVKTLRNDAGDDWVPVIFLSSRISPEDINEGILAGGDAYITKPVEDLVLKSKVTAMERIAIMRNRLISVSEQLASANLELQKQVGRDGLTGISNRRSLEEHFASELSRCERSGLMLSIIMIDVDYFKPYNDHYGHLAGDECLKALAESFTLTLNRKSDLVARYGGEEFAVVLYNSAPENAATVAERLRQDVEKLNIAHEKSPIGHVTISSGIFTACPTKDDSFESFVAAADEALYRAKKNGRNRFEQSDKKQSKPK